MKYLNGHTDAVWNMSLIDNTLVSVSADSTIRVWNPFSIDDLNEASSTSISCLNENKSKKNLNVDSCLSFHLSFFNYHHLNEMKTREWQLAWTL